MVDAEVIVGRRMVERQWQSFMIVASRMSNGFMDVDQSLCQEPVFVYRLLILGPDSLADLSLVVGESLVLQYQQFKCNNRCCATHDNGQSFRIKLLPPSTLRFIVCCHSCVTALYA